MAAGLDPFYVERFAAVRDLTWEAVYSGDPDAVQRAIAYGQRPKSYEPPPLSIRDDTLPGPHGPVPIRTYRPDGAGDACVVWMHGGAFKYGDLDMLEAHGVAAELAHRARCTAVSVDYRLVPAARYPVPLDDCVAALQWAAQRHGPIAVGGASAGANLAAACALRARDEGGPVLAAACLAYPAVHREVPAAPDELAALVEELPPLARFTAAAREEIYRDYLGEHYEDQPPYGLPGKADLGGLPPVAIANAEYDDLRPSGELFAKQLATAGVPVDSWVEPGTAHGFLNDLDVVTGAHRTLDRFARLLARVLS